MFRKIIVSLSIVLMSGLLFTNVYISMVDAHSWASNMPQSVYTEREYYKAANPGDFFRLFSPALQVILLVLLVACWKMGKQMRLLCLSAFLIGVGIDAFTFGYFYPRNAIMLHGTDVEVIKRAVQEWIFMDKFRSALCLINLVIGFYIQSKIFAYSFVVKK